MTEGNLVSAFHRAEPRRLRVAYFAGSMKPGHDGVTRVLYKLIDHLLLANVPAMFFSAIVPPEEDCKIPMKRVPSVAFPLYRDYRLAIPGFKAFEEDILSFQPDLLHINSPCSLGYAAVKFGTRHRIPVVATYHTHFPSYARYYNIPILERFGWDYLRTLYSGCERIFVPSSPIRDELAAHGMTNLEVLSHGVDCDLFSPGHYDTKWKQSIGAEGKEVLLFAGRLVWEKDLQVLADAWPIIRVRRPRAVLVFAGDGPAREEMRRLLPDAVFLGHQEGIRLSTAFASSDLFVFPSTTETFGNVILEAMASGLPAIGAHMGGVAGVITNGKTGVLAKPHDAVDFAEETVRVLENSSRRMQIRENALRHAREQSWGSVFTRLFDSYYSVVLSHEQRLNGRRKAA